MKNMTRKEKRLMLDLYRLDPADLHLAEVPKDEYSPEARMLNALLPFVHNRETLQQIVDFVFTYYFGNESRIKNRGKMVALLWRKYVPQKQRVKWKRVLIRLNPPLMIKLKKNSVEVRKKVKRR